MFNLQGFALANLVGSIIFYALTLYLLHRNESKRHKWVLLSIYYIGASLELPVILASLHTTLPALPNLVYKYLAVTLAYLTIIARNKFLKYGISALFLLFTTWSAYCGYPLWINYISYGTINGKVEQSIGTAIIFQDADGQDIPANSLYTEYIVLDFWTSSCGVCFRRFPTVQRLYDQLKDGSKINLYSVFCRMEARGEQPDDGIKKMTALGYDFPVVSIDIKDPIVKQLGVNGFPTVLIIDKNSHIIFRGSIDMAIKYLQK